MSLASLPPMRSPYDLERILEFEFVRATENAALNAIHWLGRGEKEKGDAAACDAIYGVFDILDIRGEVVIVSGSYGVRITDLVSPSERVRAIGWTPVGRAFGRA